MREPKPIRFAGAQGANLTVGSLSRELGQFLVLARAISFHPEIELPLLAVKVEWNPVLRTSAGIFYPRKRRIALHPGLRYAEPADLIDTFLHEVAHAIQYFAHRKCDHSWTWFEAMYQLGRDPRKRRHETQECFSKLTAKGMGLKAQDLGL